jgi:hypothetical protein
MRTTDHYFVNQFAKLASFWFDRQMQKTRRIKLGPKLGWMAKRYVYISFAFMEEMGDSDFTFCVTLRD